MAGSKRPILLVEGDPEILDALRRLLQQEFEVYAAADARAALQLMQQRTVHVIVASQRLPEMTGLALLRRVQQLWPETIRVALTAYSDLKAVVEGSEQAGLFRYLTKPWDEEELQQVLHQACRQYDEEAGHRELLQRLQTYQMECLQILEGLRQGSFGELNPLGYAKVTELAAVGDAILDRLHAALPAEFDLETDWPERLPAPPLPFPSPTEQVARALGERCRTGDSMGAPADRLPAHRTFRIRGTRTSLRVSPAVAKVKAPG